MAARRRGLALLLGIAAATAPACRREPAAPVLVVDARDHAKTPDLQAAMFQAAVPPEVESAVLPLLPVPVATANAGADPEYATVELSGAVEFPPGVQPKERLMVFIATRDCLNDASPLLRRLPISDNRTFFAAVMVPQGSTLSVCAAAEPAPGKPAHLYGQAAALSITKAADQTIRDLKITLSENTPRSFATKISR